MKKLVIDVSNMENYQAFLCACERLGIDTLCNIGEGLVTLKFSKKYNKAKNPEIDEYTLRTLSSFGYVTRCQ